MGICRDSRHKRRATGGKRFNDRKKRKFELGRPPTNTKIGVKKVSEVRTRGGNKKFRALRLESGNYSWGSEVCTRKTRILDVVYNASNNELVRTKTLVKGAVCQVDAAPFKAWFMKHYGKELGKKGTTILLSSHLLSDVEDVCDRMVILYGGKIRAEGTADQLLSDSNHTVIKVPHIDTTTLAAVEKTLLDSAGVTVESVESPRQRLEDFFLDIVETARAEQIANAGAGRSGPTAAFLSAAPDEGDALIETLSSDTVPEQRTVSVEKQSVAARMESEAHIAKDEVLEERGRLATRVKKVAG